MQHSMQYRERVSEMFTGDVTENNMDEESQAAFALKSSGSLLR